MASKPQTPSSVLPPVIGLYADAAQSGKSTTASILASEYGYTVVKFAGPLKSMCRALLTDIGHTTEMVERMVEGDLKEIPVAAGLEYTTPRAIMQTLGTEWGRECVAADFWVHVAIGRSKEIVAAGGRVVVDDLRFPNEYTTLRDIGAECWWVYRPGADAVASDYEGLLSGYPFDTVIYNDADISALESAVRNTMGNF